MPAAAAAATALAAVAPAAGMTAAPPRGEYAVRSACSAPRPDRAGCLALGLRPRTAAARARVRDRDTRSTAEAGVATAVLCAESYPSSCLTPRQLNGAYFPGQAPDAPAGEPQTIALVDAFNDPDAEADLAVYSSEFGLPACTAENGCFEQVGQSGGEGVSALPFPKTRSELESYAEGTARQRLKAEEAEGWALETATDVEMAHAVCQDCRILLVAANSPEFADLEAAEDTAAARAEEVSNSWGGPEPLGDSPAFDHPGVAITASTGDYGYRNWQLYQTREEPGSEYFPGADYPASSPHVVAVGGTSLQLTAAGAWRSESPWNGNGAGGSGCSESLPAPAWQLTLPDWTSVGCAALRASADVAAVADPSTGVSVYDSIPYPEAPGSTTVLRWQPVGGTSVASPIVAAMFALAGGAHGVAYPAQTLYTHLGSRLLHDVTGGGDGQCDGEYASCSGSTNPLSPRYPLDCGAGVWICNATDGYDGPTGVGTPAGTGAFAPGEAEPQNTAGEGPNSESKAGEGEEVGSGGGSGGPNPPGGSAGGATTGGSSPGGTTTGAPAGGAGEQAIPARDTTPSPGGLAPSAPRILRLALTVRAAHALRLGRGGFPLSRVAFSFVLTRGTIVRTVFAVSARTRSGKRWQTLSSASFAASAGTHRHHLRGSGALLPGVYRLTLTPLGGRARSLTLRLG